MVRNKKKKIGECEGRHRKLILVVWVKNEENKFKYCALLLFICKMFVFSFGLLVYWRGQFISVYVYYIISKFQNFLNYMTFCNIGYDMCVRRLDWNKSRSITVSIDLSNELESIEQNIIVINLLFHMNWVSGRKYKLYLIFYATWSMFIFYQDEVNNLIFLLQYLIE